MTSPRVDVPRPASLLADMSFLDGEEFRLDVLPGGLTNRNYRVQTRSGSTYVARFAGAKSALLAIDRDAEASNSRIAAELGVGPDVVQYDPERQVLIVKWIKGRTFDEPSLDDGTTLDRVAATCRRLHAGPRFAGDFDMFDIQRRYLHIVQEYGFRLPPDYLDFEPQVRMLDEVLHGPGSSSVPCHNDLLAANIMDDGQRVWFIDYEYSGNNDPCFELGNIWSEANLPEDRLEHLVTSYYGVPSAAHTARARLFALMAKYGWTLWAAIQDAVSDVDFDFWDWGMEKYVRAVAEFRSPRFPDLIGTVRDATTHEGASPWPTPSN
jgi:thiamine kinase-like enzyme